MDNIGDKEWYELPDRIEMIKDPKSQQLMRDEYVAIEAGRQRGVSDWSDRQRYLKNAVDFFLKAKENKKEKRDMTEQEFMDLVKTVNEHAAVFKIKCGMLVAECRTDDGKHLMRVWSDIKEDQAV